MMIWACWRHDFPNHGILVWMMFFPSPWKACERSWSKKNPNWHAITPRKLSANGCPNQCLSWSLFLRSLHVLVWHVVQRAINVVSFSSDWWTTIPLSKCSRPNVTDIYIYIKACSVYRAFMNTNWWTRGCSQNEISLVKSNSPNITKKWFMRPVSTWLDLLLDPPATCHVKCKSSWGPNFWDFMSNC